MRVTLGPVPPVVAAAVAERIAFGPIGEFPYEHGGPPALMLHAGMGGYTYLTPDGNVWESTGDNDDRPDTLVPDGVAKIACVMFARTRYPELAAWIPERPPGALDCTMCRGRGHALPEYPTLLCAPCGGLGWVV